MSPNVFQNVVHYKPDRCVTTATNGFKTRGSLLLVTIFQATGNTAAFFLPMANSLSNNDTGVLVIAVAFIIFAAFVVTVRFGPACLSRTEPVQVQA